MAAVMGRTEVGIREFGTNATVPDNPKAHLMYYLDCMCVLLDLHDNPNVTRLTDYRRHYRLSEEETEALIVLCGLLSPDELLGKVLIQDEDMCQGSSNQFYELSAVRSTLLLTERILIGGQQRSVKNIMACTETWLLEHWYNPMATFNAGITKGSEHMYQTRAIVYDTTDDDDDDDDSCCCTIL